MRCIGLIPNADDEIVKQVEDMVNEYILQPSTIILVTVPAEGAFFFCPFVAHGIPC